MINTGSISAAAPAARFLHWQHSIFVEGVRFWERGRLAYNGVQLLLTGLMIFRHWPEARVFFTANLGSYVGYAVMANVLYTAAYLPEAALQIPFLRPYAKPVRWVLFGAGTALACCLASLALEADVLCDPRMD